MGRSPSYELHTASVCTDGHCTMGENMMSCPTNPFKGKTLRVGIQPTFEFVLPEKLFGKPTAGTIVQVSKLLAKFYDCSVSFSFGPTGIFSPETKTFTEGTFLRVIFFAVCNVQLMTSLFFSKVLSGEEDLSPAASIEFVNFFFDVTRPIFQSDFVLISRTPQVVTTWGNIKSPFRDSTWALVFALLLLLSLLFLSSHKVYVSLGRRVKPERGVSNFFLFTFCKFTEPEPLPWFKTGYGGRLLVFVWTVMSWSLLLFYQSNLRAHLMTLQYEKPILTLQDAVDNGKKVWIANDFITFT